MTEKTKLIIAIVFFEALLLSFSTTFENSNTGCFRSQFDKEEVDRNYLQAGSINAVLNFDKNIDLQNQYQLKLDSLEKAQQEKQQEYKVDSCTANDGTITITANGNNSSICYKLGSPIVRKREYSNHMYYYESRVKMREITEYEQLVAERKKKNWIVRLLSFW